MKRLWYVFVWSFFLFSIVRAQDSLHLATCYEAAVAHAPVLANVAHLELLEQHQLAQIDAMRKPSLAFKAQGVLQSESLQLDFPPQVPIDPVELPLYRFQAYGEMQYVWYDGGRSQLAKALQAAAIARQQGELRVQADVVRQQVQDLYFQILLLHQQCLLVRSGIDVLDERIAALEVALKQGVVTEGTVLELRAARLTQASQLLQLEHAAQGAREILGVLTGLPIDSSTILVTPSLSLLPKGDFSLRADMQVYALRKAELTAQAQQLDAQRRPTVAAFAQLGVGLPNPLNFFDDNLSPYSMVGLHATWSPFDWGLNAHRRDALSVQAMMLDQQQLQQVQGLEASYRQMMRRIAMLQALLEQDEVLLAMRQQLVQEAAVQLEQGVITAADYLSQWQAAQAAQYNSVLHQIRLVQAHHALEALYGKF